MKQIELTKEQQNKLLEMCKKLFPEYKHVTFQQDAIMGAGWEYDFNNICFSDISEKIFDIKLNIHWFEFCMTHLVIKLKSYNHLKEASPLQRLNFYNFYWDVSNNELTKVHPVDYLYKIFKKLKE